jgi:uncharacterized protein (TIGR00369 family)
MLSRGKIEGQTNENCFGCGRENPIGLKLGFHSDGGSVKAEFTPSKLYEGYPGYLHGGIIFTVLDEAMGWAAHDLSSGVFAVTARSQIRFRRPVPTGEPLTIAASITRKTRKFIWTKATIRRKDGTLAAEATAIMVVSQSN